MFKKQVKCDVTNVIERLERVERLLCNHDFIVRYIHRKGPVGVVRLRCNVCKTVVVKKISAELFNELDKLGVCRADGVCKLNDTIVEDYIGD